MAVDLVAGPNTSAAKRPAGQHRLQSFAAWIPAVLVIGVLVLCWEVAVRLLNVPAYIIPSPSAIVSKLASSGEFFARNAWTTLLEALLGFFAGSLVAIVLATFMAHSRLAERVLYPVALLIKVTPIVAVAPLFVIWLGFGLAPKIIIASLITFFPVLVNALAGMRSISPSALDVLRSYSASPFELFWRLRLPSSLPYLFAAARVAIPLCLIGAVVAEWWGASDGLGRIIFLSNSNLDMPTLFAAVVVLAILGISLTGLVSFFERRLLFWHDSSRSES